MPYAPKVEATGNNNNKKKKKKKLHRNMLPTLTIL
jgi:hypothetical protein